MEIFFRVPVLHRKTLQRLHTESMERLRELCNRVPLSFEIRRHA
jgi:hypothetical protein